MRNLSISLLQVDLKWRNPPANRAMLAELIAGTADNSDLVVLPEMFTTGFTLDAERNCEEPTGETAQWLTKTSETFNIAICGSVIIRDGNRFYNRLLWAGADGSLQTYDKRHLFRMAGEDEHFTAGTDRLIVELAGWRICPLICYDLRFPVWSRGINEYDLLVYVANWPASRHSAWTALLPARAVENQCYVAAVNRVGTDGNNVNYAGGSLVVDYFGNSIARGDSDPETLSATLNLEKLCRYREKFAAWKDADRFNIYK